VASSLSIDIVMGAFLAGIVLRYWSPGDMHLMEAKLDAVGYGVFIPIFFVTSGMGLDIQSIIDDGTISKLGDKYLAAVWGKDPAKVPYFNP